MSALIRTVLMGAVIGSTVYLEGLDWSTNLLPPIPSFGAFVDITLASGPQNDQVVAAWGDSLNQSPFYAIYSGGEWHVGMISKIFSGGDDSTGVYNNIYIVAGPSSGQLVAVWSDANYEIPYYSVYDSNWTTGIIPLGGSNGAYSDVNIAAGPSTGQVMAVWANIGGNEPYYSIYNGSSWSTGTLSLGTSTGVYYDVFVTSGPSDGSMIATWADESTNVPYYSIYSSGTWTTSTIPQGSSNGAASQVLVSQGPGSGEIIAVWTDTLTKVPYYSIYSSGSWSTGAAIALGSSVGVRHNVYISPGQTPNSLVATWADSSTLEPYYAIYSGGSWQTPVLIQSGGGGSNSTRDVAIARTLGGNDLLAIWPDAVTNNPPYYAYLQNPAPLPPTNGLGARVKNQFPLQVEWYNTLTWTASTSPDITGYNIRRNGTLIASGVTDTTYIDHARPRNSVDVYEPISLNFVANSG